MIVEVDHRGVEYALKILKKKMAPEFAMLRYRREPNKTRRKKAKENKARLRLIKKRSQEREAREAWKRKRQ
jgi:hypothetical protein